MKTLFSLSLKIALLNFLISTLFILVSYFLDKNELNVKGLSLFFLLAGIVFFIVSVRRIGKTYLHRLDYTILVTSLSIIFLSLFGLGFSLFLHGYIDLNLRYEMAHTSAIRSYENIQRIEREQNVSFLFNYEEEVERVVASFEPINMLHTKLISTLISLVLYNFLVLLSIRGKSE